MSVAIISCHSLDEVTWHPQRDCTFQDNVAVFGCPLSAGVASASAWRPLLLPDELARLQRFRRLDDQHRFGTTRSLLRLLLSHYTGQAPTQLVFSQGTNNKPELQGHPGWQFNVSHGGQWVLIAIGRVSVGVDVEPINPDFPIQEIVASAFGPAEQRVLHSQADAHALFYEYWTRKEALLKATGQGMAVTLSQIPCLNGEHLRAAQRIGQPGHWTVQSFRLDEQHPATVAYQATAAEPAFYRLDASVFTHNS